MERHFQEKLLFDTHSRKKFASCADFEKFHKFSTKKPICFSKRTPNFERFEKNLFQSHSTANLLQSGEKIISGSESEYNRRCWQERNWQKSGKKTSELVQLRGRFCSHFF